MPIKINGTNTAAAPGITGDDTDTGLVYGTNQIDFSTGGTTKATIDSVGSLLMGTNSSTGFNSFGSNSGGIILDNVNSDNTLLLATHDTAKLFFGADASYSYLWCSSNHAIKIATNNTERLRISADGSISSYNSPYAYFQSNSTSTASLTIKKSASGANGIDYFQCRDSSNTLELAIAGTGGVYNVGSTYGALSDNKLKENIVDAKSQWDDIKNVKVRNFNFKSSTGHSTDKYIGVVAQELETVSPNLVSEIIDRDPDTSEDLGTKTKTVKYSILYMKAIKCLQEAQARIETIETEKTKLQTDLTALTARVTALEAG